MYLFPLLLTSCCGAFVTIDGSILRHYYELKAMIYIKYNILWVLTNAISCIRHHSHTVVPQS